MHGLNEIITANAATSQMKPQGMTRQEKKELLKAFIPFLAKVNLGSIVLYNSDTVIDDFLDSQGE